MEHCNEEIEATMEAHGIVDYFYVGVKLDGTRVSGFICGSDKGQIHLLLNVCRILLG